MQISMDFLSSDKRQIVGTETNGSDYQLLIIQITGQTYTAGSLPDAILNAHMLAGGARPRLYGALDRHIY